MSRIEDIFLLARDTLGDHAKQRYSDATLLRNLHLAIKDIAIHTNVFKNTLNIPLRPGTAIYDMPDGTLSLSHVRYNDKLLPLKSSGWMEANMPWDWKRHTVNLSNDELIYAIYDEVKRKEIAVYPRPFGGPVDSYTTLPNEYGLVGSLESEDGVYDQDSYLGVIGELVDPAKDDVQNSPYGVVSLIEEEGTLTIYYTRCPPLPATMDDDFELEDCFDSALKFYICGIALRNDVDIANRQMASEEFTLYQREIDAIKELSHIDSVAADAFESHYNPMG